MGCLAIDEYLNLPHYPFQQEIFECLLLFQGELVFGILNEGSLRQILEVEQVVGVRIVDRIYIYGQFVTQQEVSSMEQLLRLNLSISLQ